MCVCMCMSVCVHMCVCKLLEKYLANARSTTTPLFSSSSPAKGEVNIDINK